MPGTGSSEHTKIQSMVSRILHANEDYRQVNRKLQHNEISANARQVQKVLGECRTN